MQNRYLLRLYSNGWGRMESTGILFLKRVRYAEPNNQKLFLYISFTLKFWRKQIHSNGKDEKTKHPRDADWGRNRKKGERNAARKTKSQKIK